MSGSTRKTDIDRRERHDTDAVHTAAEHHPATPCYDPSAFNAKEGKVGERGVMRRIAKKRETALQSFRRAAKNRAGGVTA